MPRTNRSDNFYVKLPESLATSALPDVKMAISVTITYPKDMNKQVEKTMAAVMAEAQDVFTIRMKKAIAKLEED